MKQIKRWIMIGICMILIMVVAISVYIYSLYHMVKKVYTEEMFEPLFTDHGITTNDLLNDLYFSPYRSQPVSIKKKEPISLLVLGVDQRENDIGRSDTLLLMILNPEQGKSLLFNIPRDTHTEIAQRGTMDKINHAYAFGGVEMAVQTVETFLEIPIDYYVKVNMEGFIEIIDSLDGVDVENPFSFTSWYEFPKGDLHLDGEHALDYVRMRYEDPKGDLGRNERQRQVLKAIIQKGTAPTVLTKIDKLLNQVGKHVRTNISFDEIDNLISDYRAAFAEIDEIEIDGKGQLIDRLYYYVVHKEERERIRSLIKDYLAVPNESVQAALHPEMIK